MSSPYNPRRFGTLFTRSALARLAFSLPVILLLVGLSYWAMRG